LHPLRGFGGKFIKILLQTVEKENVILREKMSVMKTELTEATEHITQITGQLANLQISIKESQGLIFILFLFSYNLSATSRL